jgi:hypothetical protein
MQSRYHPPSVESLTVFCKNLHNNYANENSKRTKHIQMLQSIADEVPDETLLLGACIYVFESIASEYTGWFSNVENSKLYSLLKKALQLDQKNILDHKTKFILLLNFMNYAADKIDAEFLLELKNLCKKIRYLIEPEINILFSHLPTHSALMTNFAQLKKNYEVQCQKDSFLSRTLGHVGIGGHSSNRQDFLNLTQTLHTNCNGAKLFAKQKDAEEYDYVMRYGTLLYIMWQIENEYYLRSPEASFLYTECQRVTNIKNITASDNKAYKKDFSKLFAYISSIVAEPHEAQTWQQSGLSVDAMKNIQDNLTDILTELKNSKKPLVNHPPVNNFINSSCNYATNTAIQAGIATAFTKLVSLMVQRSLSLHAMLRLVKPEYAVLVFGVLTLGQWVQRHAKTNLASALATSFTPIIKEVIKAPIKGYSALSQNFFKQPPTNTPAADESHALASALYAAPIEICSAAEKSKLELLFDKELLELSHEMSVPKRRHGAA